MKNTTLSPFTGVLFFLLVLLLGACGQTGPLILPSAEKAVASENKPEKPDLKIQKQ